jgi:hypothetical protein
MHEIKQSNRYANIFPEVFNTGVFTAMSPPQFKVFGFMMRNHPNMYASEATIAEGCNLNKTTVGHILRGFVHTGLFAKTRRSKGAGLQSSNKYDLNDLTDSVLSKHLVSSFSHPLFNAVMKAMYRGGKSAAEVDPAMLDMFKWKTDAGSIPVASKDTDQPVASIMEVDESAQQESNAVSGSDVIKLDSSIRKHDAGQDILDWFKQIEIRGTRATNLLANIQDQGLSIRDLKMAYGELQADIKVQKPASLLAYRIKEGMIAPDSDLDDDYADGAYELGEEIDKLLLGPTCEMDDTLKSRLRETIYKTMRDVRVWEATEMSKKARIICRYLNKDGTEGIAVLPTLDLKQLLSMCVDMDISRCHFKMSSAEIARLVMVHLPTMVSTIEQLKTRYSEDIVRALPEVKAEVGLVWPADEPLPEDAAEQLAEFKAAKANAA